MKNPVSWKNIKKPPIEPTPISKKIDIFSIFKKISLFFKKFYYNTLACVIVLVPSILLIYGSNIIFGFVLSKTRPF